MSEFTQLEQHKQRGYLVSALNRVTPQSRGLDAQHSTSENLGNQAAQRFAQSCPLRLPSPGACPFGGVCHACPVSVQAKLTVNRPGDRYEQEADRVADQVMGMTEPATVQRDCPTCDPDETLQTKTLADQLTPYVQRQVEPEEEEEEEPVQAWRTEEASLQRQEEEPEEEEEEPIQTKLLTSQSGQAPARLEADVRSLKGSGQPLSPSERSFFEPRFGYDFGQVRIHSGARAAESVRAINARAFTVGHHVVLGASQQLPSGSEGRQLLAHELAHVVQQTKHSGTAQHVQRLVRRSRVNCPAVAGVTRNPYSADRRAALLLNNAITKIDSAIAARAANPAHADVVAVGNALWRAFRLNPRRASTWTQGAPRVRLPVIRARVLAGRNYFNSVVFRFTCIANGASHVIPGCTAGTCNATTEAFTCPSNATDLVLCPLFWSRNRNQQGRILAHEIFHIMFGFIHDWGQPDVHNAHCYAQFVALLNGFNSPAGFRCH